MIQVLEIQNVHLQIAVSAYLFVLITDLDIIAATDLTAVAIVILVPETEMLLVLLINAVK